MRIDAYTKTLLTIIALCLTWLCVRDTSLLSDAHAQPAVQEMKIVGIELGKGSLALGHRPSTGAGAVAVPAAPCAGLFYWHVAHMKGGWLTSSQVKT